MVGIVVMMIVLWSAGTIGHVWQWHVWKTQGALRQQHHIAFIRRVACAAFMLYCFVLLLCVCFPLMDLRWSKRYFQSYAQRRSGPRGGAWIFMFRCFFKFFDHLFYTLCSYCTSEERHAACLFRFMFLFSKFLSVTIGSTNTRVFAFSSFLQFFVVHAGPLTFCRWNTSTLDLL